MSNAYTAYLALGANLGDCRSTFYTAISALDSEVGEVLAVSSFIKTPALLATENSEPQPDYLNAAVACRTALSPEVVLQRVLGIEEKLGRVRVPGKRWQPRTLDIDLLLCGPAVRQGASLTLPHAEMHKRDFVLRPLAEIAPQAIHPLLGKPIAALLQELN